MAIAFAFELLHDVNALLPVMAASAVAYAFTVMCMRSYILTEKSLAAAITSTANTAPTHWNATA